MAKIITDRSAYLSLFYTLRAYIGGKVGVFQGNTPALLDGDRAMVFQADSFQLPRGAQTFIRYPPRYPYGKQAKTLMANEPPISIRDTEEALYVRMRYGLPVYRNDKNDPEQMLIYEIEIAEPYYDKVKAKLDFLRSETLDRPFPLTPAPQ